MMLDNQVFETPAGKQIALFRDPKTANFRIKFTSGGELPEELSGQYTAAKNAVRDILVYLDKQKPKKKDK